MNWKKLLKKLPGYLVSFAAAGLMLPLGVRWLMPKCYQFRSGCIGTDVWRIVGIKAVIGLIVLLTAYIATGKLLNYLENRGERP